MHLARAAQVVRKEMFEKKFSFDGSFKQSSQQNAVPQSLLALVNMILDGPNIKHLTQLTNATASLSISQLLVYSQQSVHFDYWMKTLSLEILLLLYIRSIREGNFDLYVESLAKIIPWMFALDHTHYSRWLPVHIRDMVLLPEKHPFRAGKFAVCKTINKFSAMAIDQCHEQNNAIIKESGGAIGLTNNPGALRRWMVAGPEVARMVTEFESYAADSNNGDITNSHHEQHPGVQASFLKDVKSLIVVFIDLLVLDKKDIMNISVGETVRKAEALGEEPYKKNCGGKIWQV